MFSLTTYRFQLVCVYKRLHYCQPHAGLQYWHIKYLCKLTNGPGCFVAIMLCVFFFFFCVAGPAKNRSERPDPHDGEHARADQHQPDHAILQQPHDVLPDQH